MKQIKLTVLLTVLMSMVGAKSFAYDIEAVNADGVTIYYNFINDNTELAVTSSLKSYYDSDYDKTKYTGDIVIPESVTYSGSTYNVTSVDYRAFYGCHGLTSITIPNSVTSIVDYAFDGCSGLTSVTISNGVTTIGIGAFLGCTGLTTVAISNNVTSVGPGAFQGCTSLTTVAIPNNVTSVGFGAFQGCTSLTSVSIPDNDISFDDNVFGNCPGLTSPIYNSHSFVLLPSSYSGSYTIPNGIEKICGNAFGDCNLLTSIDIPNTVISIGNNAFSSCI